MSRRSSRGAESLPASVREIAEEVKAIVKEFDPHAEVYVFGSAVRGELTAASDIDILVVTERVDRKYEMMVSVYKRVNAPVELHVTTRETYRRWYARFIGREELVKV